MLAKVVARQQFLSANWDKLDRSRRVWVAVNVHKGNTYLVTGITTPISVIRWNTDGARQKWAISQLEGRQVVSTSEKIAVLTSGITQGAGERRPC